MKILILHDNPGITGNTVILTENYLDGVKSVHPETKKEAVSAYRNFRM